MLVKQRRLLNFRYIFVATELDTPVQICFSKITCYGPNNKLRAAEAILISHQLYLRTSKPAER
jgi:hypothetical protein